MGSSATVVEVDSLTTVQTLKAARRSRRTVELYNDSSAALYVKLGAAATADDYTFKVAANSHQTLVRSGDYTGIITGLWASQNGSARVTEIG